MRLTLILSLIGALGLIFGAGLLTRPEAPARDLPSAPIVSAPIDAAPIDAAPLELGPDAPARSADDAAGRVTESVALSGPAPDPLAGALDLAVLPGRGQHTQAAYVAGSAASDLPLEDGVELLAFDDLLLPEYAPPAVLDEDEERDPRAGFPEEVLALDGERVALEGFMQPLEFNGNKVVSFVLSPYPPGCCFGGMPGLDEWVDVAVEGEGVDYFAYRVIRVTGELEVGEVLDDWGYVSSLYRMKTDKVEKLW